MNPHDEQKMAALAFETVEKFCLDYKKNPFFWGREIDVQVEIASRLKNGLKGLGLDTVLVDYKYPWHKGGPQTLSRVICEYSVSADKYKPDIILLKDLAEPCAAPDWTGQKRIGDWPFIWALEIKFDAVRKHKVSASQLDEEKLKKLIAKGVLSYGCCLVLHRAPGLDKPVLKTPQRQQPVAGAIVTYEVYAV